MSNDHKNPTISFRVSTNERKEIEARIKASGMMKKDYFVRSCIYNHVCVVGKKETIYPLVQELKNMQMHMLELYESFVNQDVSVTSVEIQEVHENYECMLKAILWMLDGAKYLWQN